MKQIESWQNNEWIPNSQIGVKLWDAHYFFGYAVFDAFRSYKHKFHMFNCHINRFYKSAKLTSIDIGMDKSILIDTISKVIDHNKGFFENDEYRFMIFASPGFFSIYDDMGEPKTTLTINLTTTSRYAKHIYPYLKDGVVSVISNQPQIPFRYLDPRIKSCSRLHYGLADLEASQYGKDAHPILLDEHGYVSESSGSNIGIIRDGELILPDSKDMLEGCTMKFVKDISKEVSIERLTPYDLIDCDCIIYTSTFSGILPSYSLYYKGRNYILNKDKGKPIFDKLMNRYSDFVGIDVERQWKDWYEKRV